MIDLRIVDGGVEIPVRVVPGASRDKVVGEHDGALKVQVSAPPVEGAANDRLVRFLAKGVLGVPRSAMSLVRGQRSRDKVVRVEGVTLDDVQAMLQQASGIDT